MCVYSRETGKKYKCIQSSNRKRDERTNYLKSRQHCAKTNKICFETKEQAMFALSQCVVSQMHRKEQRYYQCPHCNTWHLTKKKVFIKEVKANESSTK